jgi:hypothetical protein
MTGCLSGTGALDVDGFCADEAAMESGPAGWKLSGANGPEAV